MGFVAATGAVTLAVGALEHGAARAAAPAASKTVRAVSTVAVTSKMYLLVTGIQGESTDPGFVNQIVLESYAVGISYPPAGSSGKPTPADLSVGYRFDRSVPAIETATATATATATGQKINSVVLTEVGSSGQLLRTITLSKAFVDSVKPSGAFSGTTDQVQVTFSYLQETTVYYYYYPSTGGVQTYRSCWSFSTNASC